jgi:chromosome segregation ATPase
METTEKKPNGGYSRLKVKYAKLKAEHETLVKAVEEEFVSQDSYRSVKADNVELESKLKKVDADIVRLERTISERNKEIREKDETIRQQGTKISTLTADLANAQGEAREYRNKFEEAVRRMGGFRRFIYCYNRPQFTDEDRWHD